MTMLFPTFNNLSLIKPYGSSLIEYNQFAIDVQWKDVKNGWTKQPNNKKIP